MLEEDKKHDGDEAKDGDEDAVFFHLDEHVRKDKGVVADGDAFAVDDDGAHFVAKAAGGSAFDAAGVLVDDTDVSVGVVLFLVSAFGCGVVACFLKLDFDPLGQVADGDGFGV